MLSIEQTGESNIEHEAVAEQPHLISLGLFCMTRWMINAAGFQRGSYPFDDIFSSLPIVNHCLEDDFAAFLDRADYMPLSRETSWVQGLFRRAYNQAATFNHHDMAVDTNYEKFQRRVARFLALREAPAPVSFVVLHEHRNIFTPELPRLVGNLDRVFGTFNLMAIGFDAPTATIDEANLIDPRLRAASFTARSTTIDGLQFPDEADTRALIRLITDYARSTRAIARVPINPS